jgi:glycosyltransferase involved in cell wall biosynthesis
MYDLSIVIPARNEMFLQNTIDDILKHIKGNTEIIIILDGQWSLKPINDHPRLTMIYHSKSIGQRAATNDAVNLSTAKYIMKVDAHCAFDDGFDIKMMNLMQDDIVMVPMMRNLHAFDWVCTKGHRRYQSPSNPCLEVVGKNDDGSDQLCGMPTHMEIMWIPKKNPQSTAYRFDINMHFQYWNEFGKKQKGDLTESLSIQGSAFMSTRKLYLDLDLCSEQFHSWGQQGVEVACKTWLSGNRIMINRTTWYAHLFRTQGRDFGFPYENDQSKIDENRKLSRELFMGDKWPKAIHSFQWLLDKFQPPDWR